MTALGQFYVEQFLARRLREHGISITDGVTTVEQRRDRARKAIVDADLADVIIGRKDGKPLSYGEYFQRCFGEAL